MVKGNKVEYDRFYGVWVCPYCNHSKVVDIDNSTFFNWKSKTYKCSKCSREFEDKEFMVVVPKDEVRRLVQGLIKGEITKEELKEAFDKIGIYIHIPKS